MSGRDESARKNGNCVTKSYFEPFTEQTAYAKEDVDVSCREVLAFEHLPDKTFLDILRDSGIRFVEVPALDRKEPATSFKQQGSPRFHVDLLVPSSDNEIRIIKVPELKAYATALPYLAYALGQTQISTLIGREGCCPIHVPIAARFAVHKLVVSQLRSSVTRKRRKTSAKHPSYKLR